MSFFEAALLSFLALASLMSMIGIYTAGREVIHMLRKFKFKS